MSRTPKIEKKQLSAPWVILHPLIDGGVLPGCRTNPSATRMTPSLEQAVATIVALQAERPITKKNKSDAAETERRLLENAKNMLIFARVMTKRCRFMVLVKVYQFGFPIYRLRAREGFDVADSDPQARVVRYGDRVFAEGFMESQIQRVRATLRDNDTYDLVKLVPCGAAQ
jgi:hypothetical protein